MELAMYIVQCTPNGLRRCAAKRDATASREPNVIAR
jgi:hypothetical protein